MADEQNGMGPGMKLLIVLGAGGLLVVGGSIAAARANAKLDKIADRERASDDDEASPWSRAGAGYREDEERAALVRMKVRRLMSEGYRADEAYAIANRGGF